MKLLPKENLLVFKANLSGDIVYFQYWDIDYFGFGKPEKIIEFIRIGKSEPFLLLKPLLIINPPRIDGIYDKRELGNYISNEIEKKRVYLNRLGVQLSKQIKDYIINDEIVFYNKNGIIKEKYVWVKIPKKYKFLIDYFFGDEPEDPEDKIPP
ncbi:MAG: hypothetical protein PHS92_03735 [Candidatus Gracilibacteria bacterium]|nr:hypothetical protein [Candidatus Gracilibacteria bacterium]